MRFALYGSRYSTAEKVYRMSDALRRLHRAIFGYHNGDLAHQYARAANNLAAESRMFREELLAFRQNTDDPLRELIKIRREGNSAK